MALERRARLFRLLRQRSDPAPEVDSEIALHIDLKTEALISEGVSPEAARARALAAFGDPNRARRTLVADARRTSTVRRLTDRLANLGREVRLAVRSLARAPLVSIGAILALGLGIGATSAMFSIGQGIIGELPVPEPERLVQLVNVDRANAVNNGPLRMAEVIAARSRLTTVVGVGAWSDLGIHLGDGKRAAERASGVRITAGMLGLLGVAPRIGREFLPADERPGAPPVMMLSDRLWQDRFGGDPSVVGRTVRVNGQPTTIVGVLPYRFEFPAQAKAWLPLSIDAGLAATDTAPGYLTVARLAAGRTTAEAQGEAARLGMTLIRERQGRVDREELKLRPFSE